MRVFVTGATGFVGSAVVRELLAAGYQVLGLARSDAGAQAVAAAGADVHRGSIDDLASMRSGAEAAEAVIHTAFDHDFSRFAENSERDRKVIEALGDAVAGTGKRLIVTSGIGLLRKDEPITENDLPNFAAPPTPRIASEAATMAAAERGAEASIMRLPPSVHGEGDHGFVRILIDLAREKGVSAYSDEGSNRWPAVHRFDAAVAYRKALETSNPLPRYHGVAEEGIAFREIAEAIGRGLNVPAVSLSGEAIRDHFGWFAHFAAIDCASSSALTRAALDWDPQGIGLIADLDQGHYFGAIG